MRRLAARESVEDHVDRQWVERPLVELRHRAAHLPGPALGWRVGTCPGRGWGEGSGLWLRAGLVLGLGLGPGAGAGSQLGSGLELELWLRVELEQGELKLGCALPTDAASALDLKGSLPTFSLNQ